MNEEDTDQAMDALAGDHVTSEQTADARFEQLIVALEATARSTAALAESMDASVHQRFDVLEQRLEHRSAELKNYNKRTALWGGIGITIAIVVGVIGVVFGMLNLNSNTNAEETAKNTERSLAILEEATGTEAQDQQAQVIENLVDTLENRVTTATQVAAYNAICDAFDDDDLNESAMFVEGVGCQPRT